MASTRKPPPADLRALVADRLVGRVPHGADIRVGLSGGVDSVALLHLLVTLSVAHGWRVAALHVHHGLSPRADDWAACSHRLCERLGVPLAIRRVEVPRSSGEGIEAAARAARYAAYRECGTAFVALAHHDDDQAETLLLQLIRGAGPAGLAAMPVARPIDAAENAVVLLRPLLGTTRAALRAHVLAAGLEWVDDESNTDPRFQRSRLRTEVMPVLRAMQPAVIANVARAARHLGEADLLLREWGRIDADAAREPGGWSVERLARLGEARGRNALRAILAGAGMRSPSTRQIEELWRQLRSAREDASVAFGLEGREVRRFRGLVSIVQPVRPAGGRVAGAWAGEAGWMLPEHGGRLRFDLTGSGGIDAGALRRARLVAAPRVGGERFRPVGSAHHRTLKNLYQERAVPPWERTGRPLLYMDDTLAWVPGIGVAAACAAPRGVVGILPVWEPDAGPG